MANLKELKNIKKVTIDGVEYTLQKLPVRVALELRNQWHVNGEIDEIKMYELLLEHIVIEPKKTIDDFDDVVTLEELAQAALTFQYKTKGK